MITLPSAIAGLNFKKLGYDGYSHVYKRLPPGGNINYPGRIPDTKSAGITRRSIIAHYEGRKFQPSNFWSTASNKIYIGIRWNEPGDYDPEHMKHFFQNPIYSKDLKKYCTSLPADRSLSITESKGSHGWQAYLDFIIYSPDTYANVTVQLQLYEKKQLQGFKGPLTKIANDLFDQIEPYAEKCIDDWEIKLNKQKPRKMNKIEFGNTDIDPVVDECSGLLGTPGNCDR